MARFTPRGKTLASAVEAKSQFLASGVDSRGKKGRNGSEGLGKAAACGAAMAKEIGWVGAAAYVLWSSPTLHDASYSAQQSKPQHSGVSGAHVSKAARRARAPGRTDILARTMGITRVEDLPDCEHTVW